MIDRKWIAMLVIAAAALLSGCSSNQTAEAKPKTSAQHSDDRKIAPDFTLTDAAGKEVKLSDYRGKVVLLNFWATWCGPCTLEIPWFVEFEQEYKSKGFEVIGVSMDEEGWKAIKPYIAERKINYRILLGNDSVTQLYGGVDSLPTTFIIDRDGKFAFAPHVGLAAKNEYLREIQDLLGIKQQTNASLLHLHPLPAAVIPRTAE